MVGTSLLGKIGTGRTAPRAHIKVRSQVGPIWMPLLCLHLQAHYPSHCANVESWPRGKDDLWADFQSVKPHSPCKSTPLSSSSSFQQHNNVITSPWIISKAFQLQPLFYGIKCPHTHQINWPTTSPLLIFGRWCKLGYFLF